MNEKFQATHDSDEQRARASQCERSEHLVAYLYGEADPAGAKSFEQHLTACVSCREEFAAFGDVRRAVGDWRAEALGIAPTFAAARPQAQAAPVLHDRTARAPHRSALAALREFFALSPLWLRAGSIAATVLVCALAALTVARAEVRWDANGIAFRTGVEERIVEKRVEAPVQAGVSREELEQLNAGYQRELDELRSRLRQNDRAKFEVANVETDAPRRAASSSVNTAARQTPRSNATPGTPQRRPTRGNIAGSDDDDVPRLYDLLGEGR